MSGQSPVEYFLQLFDENVLQFIHKETLRYIEMYMEDNKEHLEEHPQARIHELSRHPNTLEDIKAFIVILIGIGLCGFPSIRGDKTAKKEKKCIILYTKIYINMQELLEYQLALPEQQLSQYHVHLSL